VADEMTFHPGPWLEKADEATPAVVIANPDGTLTPMYLGVSADEPIPSAETKGLLLLRPDLVQQLVDGPLTLGQYLASGGSARFRDWLPHHLVLEPFRQLRLLRTLLQLHPEVALLSEHRG
jgi:hypothetical protein